jgi:hypothetical protein
MVPRGFSNPASSLLCCFCVVLKNMVLAFWDVLALIPTPTIFQNLFFISLVLSFICLVLIPFSLLWDCALESEPWDSDLRAHRS